MLPSSRFQPSSFEILKRWTESVIDHCTASIMLCVGNDPRKEVEVTLSEDQTLPFSSWSISNNFEYISVSGGIGGRGKTFIR
jgi:hypothetical protein